MDKVNLYASQVEWLRGLARVLLDQDHIPQTTFDTLQDIADQIEVATLSSKKYVALAEEFLRGETTMPRGNQFSVGQFAEWLDRRAVETSAEPVAYCVEASHDGSLSPPTKYREHAIEYALDKATVHPSIKWTVVPLYRGAVKTSGEPL